MSEKTNVREDKRQRRQTSEWDKGQKNLDFCHKWGRSEIHTESYKHIQNLRM